MSANQILINDLRLAWKHAVRAFNAAENSDLDDTKLALAKIVTSLSQQLEFHETLSGQ